MSTTAAHRAEQACRTAYVARLQADADRSALLAAGIDPDQTLGAFVASIVEAERR